MKSFYEIHGRFPRAGESLPKDGAFVFLYEKTEPCACEECHYQRVYAHDLFFMSQNLRKINGLFMRIERRK